MTDYEKLKALLTEFGVGFTEDAAAPLAISCMHGDDLIGGYPCFFTIFEFSEDGKFERMGAWE